MESPPNRSSAGAAGAAFGAGVFKTVPSRAVGVIIREKPRFAGRWMPPSALNLSRDSAPLFCPRRRNGHWSAIGGIRLTDHYFGISCAMSLFFWARVPVWVTTQYNNGATQPVVMEAYRTTSSGRLSVSSLLKTARQNV